MNFRILALQNLLIKYEGVDQQISYILDQIKIGINTESELGELQHALRSLHLDYARYPRKKRVEVPVLSLSKCGKNTTDGLRTNIV